MLSYITSLVNYFFTKKSENDDYESDEYKEDYLAEQLIDLEASNDDTEYLSSVDSKPLIDIPRNTECFQKTGLITYLTETYVLIDGMFYFDTTHCSIQLNLNDTVLYLYYKNADDTIVIVRIIQNKGLQWGDEFEEEEKSYNVNEHVMVGEVDSREERFVYIKNSDLKFSLDDVEGSFVPVKGDWLEMNCNIQFDENKPADVSTAQVIQVISFKALRRKLGKATVSQWSGECGICDRDIFFDKTCFSNGVSVNVGSKVTIEAIESNQGVCTWRVLNLLIDEARNFANVESDGKNEDELASLNVEKDKNIAITYPLKFVVDLENTAEININLTNNSDQSYILNKWIILSKKKDSQVNIKPFISRPLKLHPKQTFKLYATCNPKFLGKSVECLIIMFKGFQCKRFIEINVTTNILLNRQSKADSFGEHKSANEKIQAMRQVMRNNEKVFVPGVKVVKPPAFIPVRLGQFPIPEKVWAAVLGDSEQTIYSAEYHKVLDRIENQLPVLTQNLNINNYIDKWHTLLYMEEIQCNINMRAFDMPKVFLIRCQEYLGIEINKLSERRPSLIKGDRVIVKDIWDPSSMQYEGFIHVIRRDLVLIKFNAHFHETYSGGDVSIEFHFSRTVFRRSHQAINLALSHLGADILMPKRVLSSKPQVDPEKLKDINWVNSKLNDGQKSAVKNILLGECRPLPYCIFGPPGTGKTVTVIETILQILKHLPESRILVATPSNSAANLIVERLLEYQKSFSSSLIRLIAAYLVEGDSIPDVIKPFCATVDIAREDTSKSKHVVQNGINLNCQTSYIGRHRVTVSTCYSFGSLAQMGLPKGHFTHVIVDEAGQATEPEIMIPLTFINKDHGQIIIAGDPLQLGPVVLSKYCLEYGMDESYMERILETYPYQRDYQAYKNGFNEKLVTKLNDNYRSLDEVLTLPSQMFYDGTLVPVLDRNEQWIIKTLEVISGIFESSLNNKGGIYVYGIRGLNEKAEDSPSWYNAQEAAMVALTACKLYKSGLNCDDIGVITPYIAQVCYLRLLFDAMGLPQPKIGTVEDFQGQERPVILISTVRSSESLIKEDTKHTLGFLRNPKRLNVALTRAQVAVLLFCNPHLLSRDPLWLQIIKNSVQNHKYLGCDLPSVLSLDDVEECNK